MSVRFAQDMASVSGSFTTGSNMALSRRRNENRMRHMPLQSTTLSIDACENGAPTQVISIQHPQRKLYEVHYAKGVGIPKTAYFKRRWRAFSRQSLRRTSATPAMDIDPGE